MQHTQDIFLDLLILEKIDNFFLIRHNFELRLNESGVLRSYVSNMTKETKFSSWARWTWTCAQMAKRSSPSQGQICEIEFFTAVRMTLMMMTAVMGFGTVVSLNLGAVYFSETLAHADEFTRRPNSEGHHQVRICLLLKTLRCCKLLFYYDWRVF
jgi:hypothetical protein